MLIDPDAVSAKHDHRGEGGEWTDEDLNEADAAIALDAAGVNLRLGDLYERVELTGAP